MVMLRWVVKIVLTVVAVVAGVWVWSSVDELPKAVAATSGVVALTISLWNLWDHEIGGPDLQVIHSQYAQMQGQDARIVLVFFNRGTKPGFVNIADLRFLTKDSGLTRWWRLFPGRLWKKAHRCSALLPDDWSTISPWNVQQVSLRAPLSVDAIAALIQFRCVAHGRSRIALIRRKEQSI